MNIHTPFSALEYIMAAHGRPNFMQYSMIPIMENTPYLYNAFLVSRQGGSTAAVIASAIHEALSNDNKNIVISTRGWTGFMEHVISMLACMYGDMTPAMILDRKKSEIRFVNNSKIMIKSHGLHASTFRGLSIYRLYLDGNIYDTDWNYCMTAVIPTLASTAGKLFAVFTADLKGSSTHQFWESFPDYSRHVFAEPMDSQTSATRMNLLGPDFFEREYMCKFI